MPRSGSSTSSGSGEKAEARCVPAACATFAVCAPGTAPDTAFQALFVQGVVMTGIKG